MTLKKKAYQDLTFADDFMFCNIMQNNLDICKDLVELILDRKIGEIKFSEAQKALDIKLGQKVFAWTFTLKMISILYTISKCKQ